MRFEELCDALRAVPKPGPFDVTLRGLGWFPNPHNPNAFFAGIEAPMALSELAKSTDAACIRLGIPAESKRYVPHMTLARIKSSEGLAELRKAVAGLPPVDFGRFTLRSFQLYQTQP